MFIKMPNYLLENKILKPSEIYELSSLLTYRGNKSNMCYPSLETLVKSFGGTIPYHNKILKKLEDKKLINIFKRKSINSQYSRNEYEFNFNVNKDFTVIPLDVIKMVVDGRLTKCEYSFYVKLLRKIKYTSKSFKHIKFSRLAEVLYCSVPTVKAMLGELEAVDLIEVVYKNKSYVDVNLL